MLLWPPAPPGALEVASELGHRRDLRPGDRLQTAGGPAWAGFVEAGLLRGFLSSVSGREATVFYARRGSLFGEGIFYETAKATLEAMAPTVVLELPAHRLRAVHESNARLKLLLVQDLESVISVLVGDVSLHAFGDLRTRLATHMLALAELDRRSDRLEVHSTRAELAAAVGSTADAVTRVVRSMAREGVLAPRPGRIQLLDLERLLTIATEM